MTTIEPSAGPEQGPIREEGIELKIETLRKKAEVFFSDESRLEGCFFVAQLAPGYMRKECIIDLFTGERAYLPFETADGEILLLQKKNIVMVITEESELEGHLIYQQKLSAEVQFISGKTIRGNIYSDLPPNYLRLSDYLNQHTTFFLLDVDSKAHLVNSRFVKIVRPVS